MPRVVHFEIQVGDVERATTFYRELFGWEFQEWGPGYWGVMTGEDAAGSEWSGINGGLFLREGAAPKPGQPVSSYVCAIDVDDCEAYAERAVTLGGAIAVPKSAMPGAGYSLYCTDTEGNQFCLWQDDPNAA